MSTSFSNYSIEVKENIIYLLIEGSLDIETSQRWIDEMKLVIKGFEGREFKILVDTLKMDGATPEAYDVIDDYNKWLSNQNIIAKAMIMPQKFLKEIYEARVPSRLGHEVKCFLDREVGEKWLLEQ